MTTALPDRLARAILAELANVHQAADAVDIAVRNADYERTYVAAAMLIDLQRMAMRLQSGAEELSR